MPSETNNRGISDHNITTLFDNIEEIRHLLNKKADVEDTKKSILNL